MSDLKTQAYYNAHAGDYLARFSRREPDQDLHDFMNALPSGARVLDAGCGPGNSAWIMAQNGFDVCAIDASPSMVQIAQDQFQVNAQVMELSELDYKGAFDGIWANFSLLHLKRNQFEPVLTRFKIALKSKGVLHLGLKTGTGEKRDQFGRFYSYYSVEELRDMLGKLGFDIFKTRQGETTGMTKEIAPFVIILAYG